MMQLLLSVDCFALTSLAKSVTWGATASGVEQLDSLSAVLWCFSPPEKILSQDCPNSLLLASRLSPGHEEHQKALWCIGLHFFWEMIIDPLTKSQKMWKNNFKRYHQLNNSFRKSCTCWFWDILYISFYGLSCKCSAVTWIWAGCGNTQHKWQHTCLCRR